MKKLTFRVDDMELRSCDSSLRTIGVPHTTLEIVKWSGGGSEEYCWTIARFIETPDVFSLQFVGDRPFKEDWIEFKRLAEFGQRFLNSEEAGV